MISVYFTNLDRHITVDSGVSKNDVVFIIRTNNDSSMGFDSIELETSNNFYLNSSNTCKYLTRNRVISVIICIKVMPFIYSTYLCDSFKYKQIEICDIRICRFYENKRYI